MESRPGDRRRVGGKIMLKKFYLAILIILGVLSLAHAEEMTADRVVAKSWELYRQARNEKEVIKVDIEYKDGRRDGKELARWIKFEQSGEDKVAVRFSKPILDEGLALLIWRHINGDDDVWLKLPSLGQERRISVSDQSKYFAETDFTYEDTRQLIGERCGDFGYRMLSSKDGIRVIEASPKSGTETGYGKRVFWIDPRFVLVKTEYYTKNGSLIKVQVNSHIKIDTSGRWRADETEVENLLLKRKTTMKTIDRKIDLAMSQEVFSRKFLSSKR
jgi:hypothetical protein